MTSKTIYLNLRLLVCKMKARTQLITIYNNLLIICYLKTWIKTMILNSAPSKTQSNNKITQNTIQPTKKRNWFFVRIWIWFRLILMSFRRWTCRRIRLISKRQSIWIIIIISDKKFICETAYTNLIRANKIIIFISIYIKTTNL